MSKPKTLLQNVANQMKRGAHESFNRRFTAPRGDRGPGDVFIEDALKGVGLLGLGLGGAYVKMKGDELEENHPGQEPDPVNHSFFEMLYTLPKKRN